MKVTQFLFLFLFAMPMGSLLGQESTVPVPYRGVDQRVKLDRWTQGLINTKPKEDQKTDPSRIRKRIKDIFNNTILNGSKKQGTQVRALFDSLVREFAFVYPGANFEVFSKISNNILLARDELRLELDATRIQNACTKLELDEDGCELHKENVQQVILLLQILAEEALYVGTLTLKDSPAEVRYFNQKYYSPDAPADRTFMFLGGPNDINKIPQSIQLFEGDVILSKGNSGSSSFLSRITKYPGAFSHSTAATIRGSKLRFPEAFIEDGVLLRDPQDGYINQRKKKTFVYRYRGDSAFQQKNTFKDDLGKAITSFLQVMNSRSKTQPEKIASFEYDFEMDADNMDKMFCSEVVYHMYNHNKGITGLQNPYDRAVWSKTEGMTKEFFEKFLGITIDVFPAPSDLESNSQFGLVGYSFALSEDRITKDPTTGFESSTKINLSAEERIDTALIDTLLYLMDENKTLVSDYLDDFENIGNEPISDQQILVVSTQLKLKGVNVPPHVLAALKNRPQNISAKQLLFFSYLNDVMTPSIRASFDPTVAVGPLKLRSDMVPIVEKHLRELRDISLELASSYSVPLGPAGK
jgi:hypothetical protein